MKCNLSFVVFTVSVEPWHNLERQEKKWMINWMGMDSSSSQGYLPALNLLLPLYSLVSCPRTQCNDILANSHACKLKTSISRQLTLTNQFLTSSWKMQVIYNHNRHTFQKYVNSNHCEKWKIHLKWVNDDTFLESQSFDKKSIGNEVVFSQTCPHTGIGICSGPLWTSLENF